MSKRTDVDLIEDIMLSIERICSYTHGMEYSEFTRDYKTQDAVIRNIEIMGEATKSLSEEVRELNQEIPWKSIAGTRDKLIHDYFGVNIDIVWNIASSEMPKLFPVISAILQEMKRKNG